MIRAALGETDVDLSGISRGARLSIRLLAAIVATDRMGFGEAEMGQLITEAEQVTFGRGWDPPLAEVGGLRSVGRQRCLKSYPSSSKALSDQEITLS